MDKKYISTFINNFVDATEIITDYELSAPVKYIRKQLAEVEMK